MKKLINIIIWIILAYFFPLKVVKAQDKLEQINKQWSKYSGVYQYSNNGKWCIINELLQSNETIYHLIKTDGTEKHLYQQIVQPLISENNKWFAYLTKNNEFILLNLLTKEEMIFLDVRDYAMNFDGNYIAFSSKKLDIIKVLDLNSKKVIFETKGEGFKWNPIKSSLAISKNTLIDDRLIILDLSKKNATISELETNLKSKEIKWSKNGNVLVQIGDKSMNVYFDDRNFKQFSFPVSDKKMNDCTINLDAVELSTNGETILFDRIKNHTISKEDALEIWNGNDAWIYPKLKEYDKNERYKLRTKWNVLANTIEEIGTLEFPTVISNPNHSTYLVYNKLQVEPQFYQFPFADIFLKDETEELTLISKLQYVKDGYLSVSSKGNFIAYFKDNDWFVYNKNTKITSNFTTSISSKFSTKWVEGANLSIPYKTVEWSTDEKYILITDQFDVWLMKVDGSEKRRLTDGYKSKTRYRLMKDNFSTSKQLIGIDIQQPIFFEVSNQLLQTTWAKWTSKKGLELESFQDAKVDQFMFSKDKRQLIYSKRKYSLSPHFYHVNELKSKQTSLLKTNDSLTLFQQNKYEIIFYKTAHNDSLRAVLIYPINYDSTKKYPMIVSIYENNSENIHLFSPPTNEEYIGFNALKYSMEGYFILLPDIKYEINQPGRSALVSVESAVKESFKISSIDQNRVGIIGHSFGGYETAYIITQSKLFKAAVVGATTIDLVSWYHDISWDLKKEQQWRIENQQFRMVGSFYENKKDYQENSPLYNLDNISTSVLIWTGKEDSNANWYQNIYLYTGLRRLNKEVKMLLFEGEGHFMTKAENQIKLSREIKKWFDTHLK